MNSYLPFARKYRPQEFDDLVGQEVLARTMNSVIKYKKYPSGILLSGIRGVGKTTSARIIAKTINCSNPSEGVKYVKSCLKCTSCISFKQNNHPDIIEIDAASTTGVDDVRQIIIENVEYKPMMSSKKVYIIDEVHMFSKNAFNALLKVFEEPPKHIIFILATTEPEKIPVTIISRCQKFWLKRIDKTEIIDLLQNICSREEVLCERDVLELIAAKSEGSARDAISILDQLFTISSKMLAEQKQNKKNKCVIDIKLAQEIIGSGDIEDVFQFFLAILSKKFDDALNILGNLYANTTNLSYFIENVIGIICYASKLKVLSNYAVQPYNVYNKQIKEIISELDLGYLTIIWQIFAKNMDGLKKSNDKLAFAEMITLNAIYASTLPTPEELMSRVSENCQLNQIPRQLSNGKNLG